MKKILKLVLFIPFIGMSQTPMGVDINGQAPGDQFGYRVSLSSDGFTMAVGAVNHTATSPSYVRVYKYISGNWEKIGSDINAELRNDTAGHSVSLSSDGSIVAIGAPANDKTVDDNSGHVRVYQYIIDEWKQVGSDIDGEAAGDFSGYSVSLSGDGSVVAIGAINNDNGNPNNNYNSGHVRVYKRNMSDNWEQLGLDIVGEARNDRSGHSVSLSNNGSILAIGAAGNNVNTAVNAGHVRVYEYITDAWRQVGDDIDGRDEDGRLGWSVSLSADGTIVAAGAPFNDGSVATSGHVRVFENQSGAWKQIGLDINGTTSGDQFGKSVSLSDDGSIVAVGAPYSDVNGKDSGYVRAYQKTANEWKQIGVDINGKVAGDQTGKSVSLSSNGSIVAIGEPIPYNNPSGVITAGRARVYELDTAVLSSDSFVLSQLGVIPNPASSQITIGLNKGLTLKTVSIYNNLGQFIQSTQKEVIDTSGLSAGLYYVEVVTNKGKATKKLVIE